MSTDLEEVVKEMRRRVRTMRESSRGSDKMEVALDDVTAALEALVPVVLKQQRELAAAEIYIEKLEAQLA